MRSSWLLVGVSPFVLAAACSSDDGGSGTGGSAGVGGGFGGVGAQGGAAGSAGSFGGSAGSLGGSAGQAGDAAAGSAGQDGSAASGGVGGVGGAGGSGAIDGGPPPVVTPGAADRILLKGTVITPTGPIAGEVLVEQTNITCVAASCSAQAGASGATVIETNGVILPGMIDAHNHGLFNIFDESDWTPTKLYMNHNQWTSPSNEPRYTQTVDAKQYLEAVSNGANVSCEMDKYAETKAIIGATTSFLLAGSQQRSCYASVARTIDTTYNDLPADKVQVSSLGVPDNDGAKSICANFASGTTDAYVVHVAEGIDGTSKNEFTALQARGVLNDPVGPPGCLMNAKTTIVHGTALGAPEFTIMAQNDMGLVWSPKSNVFLYGATTNIPAAIAAGVDKIALAPDWALGGSVNLLDELAFAANFDDTTWGDALSSQRLVEMVTIDAARALGVQQYIGSLEVGKRADIAVVSDVAADAYDSVIQARPSTVRLVMVDGRILYGDQAIEPAAPTAPGCENLDVCGAPKIVCIAETSTANKLNQTLAQIKTVLETELSAYDATEQPAGGPFMPIAPLFKCP